MLGACSREHVSPSLLYPSPLSSPSLSAHENNAHCLPMAVNSIGGSVFSFYGGHHQRERMKEFLVVRTAVRTARPSSTEWSSTHTHTSHTHTHTSHKHTHHTHTHHTNTHITQTHTSHKHTHITHTHTHTSHTHTHTHHTRVRTHHTHTRAHRLYTCTSCLPCGWFH